MGQDGRRNNFSITRRRLLDSAFVAGAAGMTATSRVSFLMALATANRPVVPIEFDGGWQWLGRGRLGPLRRGLRMQKDRAQQQPKRTHPPRNPTLLILPDSLFMGSYFLSLV